jgi:hypothetical protein
MLRIGLQELDIGCCGLLIFLILMQGYTQL